MSSRRETLPPTQVVAVRYEQFVARPQMQIKRICERIEVPWDGDLAGLPLSRHTLTPLDPEKWRKHEQALARVLPLVEATRVRAERFFAR